MTNNKKTINFLNKNQGQYRAKTIIKAIKIIKKSKQNKSPELKIAINSFLESYNNQNKIYSREEEINKSAHNLCQALNIYPNTISSLSDKNNKNLWSAYTIYDYILDSNTNNKKLPEANLSLIKYCQNINNIRKEIAKENKTGGELFYKKSFEILQKMEEANAREIKNQKMPPILSLSPQYLSQKSLGQAIPSIAIFCAYKPDYLENIISFHIYYLAARQLADDLHDRKNDASDNQYNPLNEIKRFDYTEEMIIDLAAKKIQKYCQQARDSIYFIKDKKIFEPIDYLEERASKWLANKILAKKIIIGLHKIKTLS